MPRSWGRNDLSKFRKKVLSLFLSAQLERTGQVLLCRPLGFHNMVSVTSQLRWGAHSTVLDWSHTPMPSFLSLPGGPVLDPGLVRPSPDSGSLSVTWSLPPQSFPQADPHPGILASPAPPLLCLGMFASLGRRGRVWKPLALRRCLSWDESRPPSSSSFIQKLLITKHLGRSLFLGHFLCWDFLYLFKHLPFSRMTLSYVLFFSDPYMTLRC